jgi:hypothetical protein
VLPGFVLSVVRDATALKSYDATWLMFLDLAIDHHKMLVRNWLNSLLGRMMSCLSTGDKHLSKVLFPGVSMMNAQHEMLIAVGTHAVRFMNAASDLAVSVSLKSQMTVQNPI